ncbi:hypothetical protein VB151_12080 [Xanthomonas fragariae]|nr:hypothetical protein [Xanthomonas fragariae]MDM7571202.1 hypothetical protein [Xanthomonas fragariae]MDM7580487.1 hypothetical protein [Xanthomonas fragariae]MEA5172740.1 hypothetical protein [Xanthomonas fragariae]MEA5185398.1 hypothetical protein [Xanthomonas fragariae]MEA5197463.1 hypothetical protein [Xanthomonas fragariae]
MLDEALSDDLLADIGLHLKQQRVLSHDAFARWSKPKPAALRA